MAQQRNYKLGPPITDPEFRRMDAQLGASGGVAGDGLAGATTDVAVHPRDLVHVREQILEDRRDELIARNVFPMGEEADESDNIFEWEESALEGEARIGAYTDDIPYVDENLTPQHTIIYPILSGFFFTIQDVRIAREKGRPIRSRKAGWARRFVAEKENEIAFQGHPDYGIEGVFNKTDREEEAVPNGNWSDSATTAMDIYDDIVHVWGLIAQRDGIAPQALVLNSLDYTHMQKRSANSDRSVVEMVNDAGLFPDDIHWSESIDQGSIAVVDSRPENMVLEVPFDVDTLDPVRMSSFWWEVGVEERTPGLIIFRPEAVAVGTGI